MLSADSRSGVFIFYSLCSDISVGSDSASGRHSSSLRNRSFESLSCQTSLGRSSKLLQNQFRSLVRSEFTVAPFTLSTNPTLSRINTASFWHLKGLSQPFVPGPITLQATWEIWGSARLACTASGVLRRPAELPDDVDACGVVIWSLGSLSTSCDCGSCRAARAAQSDLKTGQSFGPLTSSAFLLISPRLISTRSLMDVPT